MKTVNILAQAMGFIAMGASIISFQFDTKKKILFAQMMAALFFALNFGMLGAITGAAMNITSIIRNIIYYNNDKKFFSGKIWTYFFVLVNIIVGVIFRESTWAVLSIIGMVLNTISLSIDNPQKLRWVMLISSPFVLVYSFITGSVGGFINELISEASIISALVRYREEK